MNEMLRICCVAPLLMQPMWYNTPGDWVEQYEVQDQAFVGNFCSQTESTCTSFMSVFFASERTCLRFENPFVTYNSRIIQGVVTEKGVPGEIGWQWQYNTTELFTGKFEWHVHTVDVCPKVG